jgi:hypothetical protein
VSYQFPRIKNSACDHHHSIKNYRKDCESPESRKKGCERAEPRKRNRNKQLEGRVQGDVEKENHTHDKEGLHKHERVEGGEAGQSSTMSSAYRRAVGPGVCVSV